MSDDVKIECQNCVFWKSRHCDNFSSKWMGMVTSPTQNCGKFKPKKQKKEDKKTKQKDNKKEENTK